MNGGDRTTADELAHELQLLARASDRASAIQLDLDGLWSLVGEHPSRLEVLLSRISVAVESMPEPERSAARHMFVRPGPWRRDLGARQARASEAMLKKPASFRTRRQGSMSPYDRLTVALAHRLLADATLRPPGSEAPPTVVAVSSSTLRLDGCHIPVGALMVPIPAHAEVVTGFQRIFLAEDGRTALGCPVHTARKWGVLWLQEFEGGTEPAGVIVLRPDGFGLWMPAGMFDGYFRAGGDDGSAAQLLAGLPTARKPISGSEGPNPAPRSVGSANESANGSANGSESTSRAVGVELSLGGLIVSEHPAGRGVWVPPQAIATWDRNGGASGPLGLPMADVNWRHGRLHQDFAGGYVYLAETGTVEAVIVDPDDAQRRLHEIVEPDRPTVLSLYDGSLWIVVGGQRRWLRDEHRSLVLDTAVEVAASTLCRLPLGKPIEVEEIADLMSSD